MKNVKPKDNKENPCESCGTIENVKYVAEPYLEEIYNETKMVWICDKCYYERVMDI